MPSENRFPEWKQLYENTDVQQMPWYLPTLDNDLEQALEDRHITRGAFLDIGTGPATQALELAKRGFTVTGTDLAPRAIILAKEQAQKLGLTITFVTDDILNTKVRGPFDYAFDRGCFHTLPPDSRDHYVSTVRGFLRPGGYLFLKTFSASEPDTGAGPYRFSSEMIREIFARSFIIEEGHESQFKSPTGREPKSLFTVLKAK